MKNLLTENCVLPPIDALTGQRNRLPPDHAQSTDRAQPVRARTAFSFTIERGRAGDPAPNRTLGQWVRLDWTVGGALVAPRCAASAQPTRTPQTDSLPTLVPSFLGNRRVLIVDDNATNRKFLDRLCTAWGLRHRVTDSAAAALSQLRWAAQAEAPFDLVMVDHHMPDADGLVLAKAIQGDSTIPRPALVMLASRDERPPQAQMEAHGLAACELKPIHPEKLRATLGRVFATSRSAAPAETPAAPCAHPTQPASGSGRGSILVAEDNPMNQKVTLLQLRKLGYAADLAVNGVEAVAALRRKSYALVLMDQQMPEMDGIAATRCIRAAQAAGEPGFPPDLRIVAMTGNAMAGDRDTCLAAGMDDYLAKPVCPDALRAILSRYLKPKLAAAA